MVYDITARLILNHCITILSFQTTQIPILFPIIALFYNNITKLIYTRRLLSDNIARFIYNDFLLSGNIVRIITNGFFFMTILADLFITISLYLTILPDLLPTVVLFYGNIARLIYNHCLLSGNIARLITNDRPFLWRCYQTYLWTLPYCITVLPDFTIALCCQYTKWTFQFLS